MGMCICLLLHLECHLGYGHEIWGSLTRAFKTEYSPQIGGTTWQEIGNGFLLLLSGYWEKVSATKSPTPMAGCHDQKENGSVKGYAQI